MYNLSDHKREEKIARELQTSEFIEHRRNWKEHADELSQD
jgi:hypothetical protein